MNLEKIEWLANDALNHTEKNWSNENVSHEFIIRYMQVALKNIKFYVEDEIKSNSK